MVLVVMGFFLFGIAYSTYGSEYSTYQNCLSRTVYNGQYCNSQVPVGSWIVPLEIVGGVLAAVGIGLIVLPFVAKTGTEKPTSPSSSS